MNWLNSNMHSDESDTDSSSSDTVIRQTKRFYVCAVCDQSTNNPIYNKEQSCLQCPRCKRSWCLYDPKKIKKCPNLDLVQKRHIEIKFSQRKTKHNHHTTRHQLSWIGTNVLGNLGDADATFNDIHLATNTEDVTAESLRVQRRFGIDHELHPTHPLIIGLLPQFNVKDNKTHQLLLKHSMCPICHNNFVDEHQSDDGLEEKHDIQATDDKHGQKIQKEEAEEVAVDHLLHDNQQEMEEKIEIDASYEDSIVRLWCGHLFHSQCVVPWLSKHNTCPMCRYALPSNNPRYELNRRAETYSNGVYHVMT